jgi:peptidoglycan/LPS O-acetylase OafA/YrhL
MVEFFIFGFIGGILRGIVGLIKYSNSYKDVEIRPWYFTGMVVFSGFLGSVAAWVVHDLGIDFLGVQGFSPALGVVMGYAGGDLLENIVKIFAGKTTLFK